MNRVSRKRRRVNAFSERNITIRCPWSVSAVSVGGQCLRDLRDLHDLRAPRDEAPLTVSVYATPLVGEGFGVRGHTRDLRDLRDHQIESFSSSPQLSRSRHEKRENQVKKWLYPYCIYMLLPFTAIYCHLLPFTAIYCHLLPFTAIYCHLLPFTAVFPPFLAISRHFSPFPACIRRQIRKCRTSPTDFEAVAGGVKPRFKKGEDG